MPFLIAGTIFFSRKFVFISPFFFNFQIEFVVFWVKDFLLDYELEYLGDVTLIYVILFSSLLLQKIDEDFGFELFASSFFSDHKEDAVQAQELANSRELRLQAQQRLVTRD